MLMVFLAVASGCVQEDVEKNSDEGDRGGIPSEGR
jgi:hypothetical protein